MLQPVVLTPRANAVTALAHSPWAPVFAVGGQKQVLLYHTDTQELLGVLPFPEGNVFSVRFSRNGQLLLAAGGIEVMVVKGAALASFVYPEPGDRNMADANSTLANNSGYGSAIHNWTGTLYLRNSVLTGTCVNQGTLASSVHNFVSNGGCSAAYSGTPYLSTLGNYGGPSTGSGAALQTFALLPGSPAFDRGDAAYCEPTDQRGMSRYGVCDLGAFESQGFTMVYATGSNQAVDAGLAFSTPLAVTMTANAAAEPVGPGGNVTFAAPTSGASISTPPLAATTNLTGASPTVTANRIAGP